MQNSPSRQMQDELRRFQSMGQQLDIMAQQIFTVDTSIKEKENAIKELEDSPDDVVAYRQVGGILLKSNKAKILEELKDEKTTLEMRKMTLERNEKSIRSKFDEMKNSLQKKMKNSED